MAARAKYEADRTALLKQFEQIREGLLSAEEKPRVREELNAVELEYSRYWQRLTSGARGAEILYEVEKTLREATRARAKSAKHRQTKQAKQGKPGKGDNPVSQRRRAPKTRVRRNSSRRTYLNVMRELQLEARRHEQLAASDRRLEAMVWNHPYKENSVADDRLYQTSGARNPRALRSDYL